MSTYNFELCFCFLQEKLNLSNGATYPTTCLPTYLPTYLYQPSNQRRMNWIYANELASSSYFDLTGVMA